MMNNIAAKALDLLEDGKNWVKEYYGEDDKMCLMRALDLAWFTTCAGRAGLGDVIDVVHKIIREQYNITTVIPSFNDHPDTTFDDIRIVLEKAALKLEEIDA